MSGKYLIFGATGSIGSSLAEKLANDKAEIHLVARNEDEVKPIAEKLGCTFTVADVLQDGFMEKVKSDVPEAKGIAYCIGSIDLKPVRITKEEDFNKCMKLNLYSAVEAIKGFQDSLRKNKGSIVLFSTAAVHRGFTNHSIIASAKAAVEGLAISLAAEFAPNIRVNCIVPGWIITERQKKLWLTPEIEKTQLERQCIKRMLMPEDISKPVLFFASDQSSGCTAQNYVIDGGIVN